MTSHVWKLNVHHRKKRLLIHRLVLRNRRGAKGGRFCSLAALAAFRGGGRLWFSVCIRGGTGVFGVCDVILACDLVRFVTLEIQQGSGNSKLLLTCTNQCAHLPANRLTLEQKRERGIERPSREMKNTFLAPLHQNPSRWITLFFATRPCDSKVSIK